MKAKGLIVKPYPRHWVNWQNPDKPNDKFTKEEIIFNNKILIDKRPYFMKYLYSTYKQDYNKHRNQYDYMALRTYGLHIDDLLDLENPDEGQQKLIESYRRYNPLLETDCVMNNICRYMEKKVKEIKVNANKKTPDYIFDILYNKDIEITQDQIDKMEDVFKKWKKSKSQSNNMTRELSEGEEIDDRILPEDFLSLDYDYISDDIQKLANLAVYVNYHLYPTSPKNFCWDLFSAGIILNIYDNSDKDFTLPLRNSSGDIEYMGKRYKNERVNIKCQ